MIYNVIKKLIDKNISISTAESITGGMLVKLITDVPGSSNILKESFITYAINAKISILGVDPLIIKKYGVVSEEVAKDMVVKLKMLTGDDICISTTGNAGPTVCDDKPIGRVYVGVNYFDEIKVIELNLDGDRNSIREKTCKKVFEYIDTLINF